MDFWILKIKIQFKKSKQKVKSCIYLFFGFGLDSKNNLYPYFFCGIGFKFQKSYPYDLELDTNSKFWICIRRIWIQLFENVSAKSSRWNERLQKTNQGFQTRKNHFKEILGHFLFHNIVNHRFYEKCLRFIDFLAFFKNFLSGCFHNI